MKLLVWALVSYMSVFPPESMYLSAKGPSCTRGNQGLGSVPPLTAEAVGQLPCLTTVALLEYFVFGASGLGSYCDFWASASSPNLVCLWLEQSWLELVVAGLPFHPKEFFLHALVVRLLGVN